MNYNTLDETLLKYKIMDSLDLNTAAINGWDLELNSFHVHGVKVYRGKVKNRNSAVHLVEHSDHISGKIQIEDTEYRIDALNMKKGKFRSVVLYDTKYVHRAAIPCSKGRSPRHLKKRGLLVKRDAINRTNDTLQACEMALLADATFIAKFGNDTKSKMVEALQIASGIYEKDLKVKLEAKEVQLLSDPSLKINSLTDISEILSALATEDKNGRYGSKTDAKNYCLSHLFTAKSFGQVLGLNTVDSICKASNVGLSTSVGPQNDLSPAQWHTTVVHEISHGFGALHDDTTSCGGNTGKIMNSSVGQQSDVPGFSQCSISDMMATIQKNDCFKAPDNSTSIAPSNNSIGSSTPNGSFQTPSSGSQNPTGSSQSPTGISFPKSGSQNPRAAPLPNFGSEAPNGSTSFKTSTQKPTDEDSLSPPLTLPPMPSTTEMSANPNLGTAFQTPNNPSYAVPSTGLTLNDPSSSASPVPIPTTIGALSEAPSNSPFTAPSIGLTLNDPSSSASSTTSQMPNTPVSSISSDSRSSLSQLGNAPQTPNNLVHSIPSVGLHSESSSSLSQLGNQTPNSPASVATSSGFTSDPNTSAKSGSISPTISSNTDSDGAGQAIQ